MTKYELAMKRLNSFGMLLTGRIAGTLRGEDPRSKGYRDLFQKLLSLQVQCNALGAILIEKGIMTREEFTDGLANEAKLLTAQYEKSFPGVTATDEGLSFDAKAAAETMRGWPS